MRIVVLTGLVSILLAVSAGAAERPMLVRIEVADRAEAAQVGAILSLDEGTRGNVLMAWGTAEEIAAVEALGFWAEPVPPPFKDIEALTMCPEPFEPPFPWDCYPSWSQFEAMMHHYANTYPDLVELVNLGMSGGGGHELWALKISDPPTHPATEEDEPEILYTGTMHGDELVCYPTTVRLVDHLLANYGVDPQVTRLIDETVLWINPMSNPDGTFDGGDHTVAGASRGLPASGYADANRSFPDPSVPDDPTAPGWPSEVQHLMDLAADEHFTLAANCHAGAEVFNYPWDVWSFRPVDDDWWIDVGIDYAAAAHAASPAGYFTMCPGSCPYPGVTNGWDWYTTSGNRQDFMNWYHGCREVTLELADDKFLDAHLLDDHFDYNRQSLLDFFDRALTGIRGVITDAVTGDPVAAEIRVPGHDIEAQRSWVSTDPDVGDYHRLIEAGTWDLEISAPGYDTSTVAGVVVQPDSDATVVDVELVPWPRYDVTGLVIEAGTGSPVEGATVTLLDSPFDAAVTDATGVYTIPYVWEGTFTFRVERYGYSVIESDRAIGPGSSVHDFELVPIVIVLEADFEVSDGGFAPSAGWAWGSDAEAGAHSGTRVWGTVLGGDYGNGVQWTLDTPSVEIPAADGAELRFWQWYRIEDGYDGGRIEVAADGGAFTTVTPAPDYNDQSITAFGGTPGFTGSAGWHEVTVDLTSFVDSSVVVRWRFASDGSLHERGWYLDDMSIGVWGGDVEPPLFADGFDSGDTSAWSFVVPLV